MKLIQHITVGSGGAASITFSSIPGTFTDLVLVVSDRTTRTGFPNDEIYLKFNNSASNYSTRVLFGNGSGVSSFAGTSGLIGFTTSSGATANTFSSSSTLIPNYSGSNAKSYSSDHVAENNATAANQTLVAGLWNDTSAITRIDIYAGNSSNLVEHSSATLYGILKGSDGITTAT